MLSDRWYSSHLKEVSREECLELLASRPVGRIAYCTLDGPVVLPVNHVVEGEHIVFRTSPHTDLGRHMIKGMVAYEVDDVDEYNQTGWSVLVRGTAELDTFDLRSSEAEPEPWAEGYRPMVVRITPRLITGRRLLPA